MDIGWWDSGAGWHRWCGGEKREKVICGEICKTTITIIVIVIIITIIITILIVITIITVSSTSFTNSTIISTSISIMRKGEGDLENVLTDHRFITSKLLTGLLRKTKTLFAQNKTLKSTPEL